MQRNAEQQVVIQKSLIEELLKVRIRESFMTTRMTMNIKTEGPDADMIASEISGARSQSIKYQPVME